MDFIEQMDFDKYDIVVVCLGDGMLYEIFNGLVKWLDVRRVLGKIVVSYILCGLGNVMFNNWNGLNYFGFVVFVIVKGVVMLLDFSFIMQGDRCVVLVFSQVVGIMVEVDLMMEYMCWMGNKRFDVGLMQCVFVKKCYLCDLVFKVEVEGKENVRVYYKRLRESNGNGREMDWLMVDGYVEDDKGEGLLRLRYGMIQDELFEGWELVRYDIIGNFFVGNVSVFMCLF